MMKDLGLMLFYYEEGEIIRNTTHSTLYEIVKLKQDIKC